MKTYSYDQAYDESLKYFDGDSLAASTWINKYALRDSEGNLLESNPEMMHNRIIKEIMRVERMYGKSKGGQVVLTEDILKNLLYHFKYVIPGGSAMSGIGNRYRYQSISNCFVIEPPQDSYGGIFRADQELVQLMKRRGGVGTDLSWLRPNHTKVSNSALTSSGLVSFMKRFSNSTREVAQGGRRGALMLSVLVTHPDAEDFINAKLVEGEIDGANISVKLTDKFMKAVKEDGKFLQKFPINITESELGIESLDDYTLDKLYEGKKSGTYFKVVKAKRLWDKIIKNAHDKAEPGVLFWDTIIKESPADYYKDLGYETVGTNPCGEIPLSPYDSCRLISLNLYSFVCNPFQKDAFFDNSKFILYARYTQRIMDDLVTIESECIERIIKKIESDPEGDEVKRVELDLWNKILERNNSGRRTGVGITAEGDMLAALGIQYGSDKAIEVSTQIHESLAEACYIESIQLAKERGSFKVWDLCETSGFLARMFNSSEFQKVAEDYEKYGRRNISNLTIAPTGTVSLMTQTTSGIEPLFKAWYVRRRKTSDKDKAVFVNEVGDMFEEFKVIHPKFVEWYRLTCMPFCTFEAAKEFLEERDEVELQRIFETSPYYKSTAQDIDWVAKVKMQGSIQKWVDHSISCTVNLPKGTPVSVVNDVYMTAYDSGCKGVTCYVDGSRDGVLITEKKDKKSDFNLNKKRPQVLKAKITRFKNGGENWIAFVGLMNNQPYECFLGKVDDDIRYLPKSVTEGEIHQINLEEPVPGKKTPHRYDFIYEVAYGYKNALPGISAMFRTDFWNYARFLSSMLRSGLPLVDILNVIDGLSSDQGEIINSWKKGVARALRQFVQDGEDSGEICQKCGGHIVYQGGCKICTSCGDTKCE